MSAVIPPWNTKSAIVLSYAIQLTTWNFFPTRCSAVDSDKSLVDPTQENPHEGHHHYRKPGKTHWLVTFVLIFFTVVTLLLVVFHCYLKRREQKKYDDTHIHGGRRLVRRVKKDLKQRREKQEKLLKASQLANTDATKNVNTVTGAKVLFVHDSLFLDVDMTKLRKVARVEKLRAPLLSHALAVLDRVSDRSVDVVVVQTLYKDVASRMGFQAVTMQLDQVVQKARQKGDRVVISTVVDVNEDRKVRVKGELINASVKAIYLDCADEVFVCDNRNIVWEKYARKDCQQLTKEGRKLLEMNLHQAVVGVLKEKGEKRNPDIRLDIGEG